MVMRMEDGFENEEYATVCSDDSTGIGWGSGAFARPLTLTFRWNETFIPRQTEFKGWVTDNTKSSIQGITDDEVVNLVSDLEKWFHSMPTSGLTGTRPGKDNGNG